MSNTEYEEILKSITLGLTGDWEKDFPYLQEKMELYKSHPMGFEIMRACGRLMYSILPEDEKKEFKAAFKKDAFNADAVVEEVKFNIYKKDFEKALDLINNLIEYQESTLMYRDDQISEYRCFSAPFEEMLYVILNKPEKDVRHAPDIYAEMYFLKGNILIDLNCVEEARASLEKAIHWSPMTCFIRFEYAETFKILGDFDRFYEETLKAHKIAYLPRDIARCFRNLGFYYIEKELYDPAVCCFLISSQFEESQMVQSELFYIQSKAEKPISHMSIEQIKACSSQYGFPLGPDDEVLTVAYHFGKKFLEEKNYEAAHDLLSIVFNLTNDPDIKKMLDRIPIYS